MAVAGGNCPLDVAGPFPRSSAHFPPPPACASATREDTPLDPPTPSRVGTFHRGTASTSSPTYLNGRTPARSGADRGPRGWKVPTRPLGQSSGQFPPRHGPAREPTSPERHNAGTGSNPWRHARVQSAHSTCRVVEWALSHRDAQHQRPVPSGPARACAVAGSGHVAEVAAAMTLTSLPLTEQAWRLVPFAVAMCAAAAQANDADAPSRTCRAPAIAASRPHPGL